MSQIHELYGILSEQHQSLLQEYKKLLSLVTRIKLGAVDPRQVQISDDGNNWKVEDQPLPPKATTEPKILPPRTEPTPSNAPNQPPSIYPPGDTKETLPSA